MKERQGRKNKQKRRTYCVLNSKGQVEKIHMIGYFKTQGQAREHAFKMIENAAGTHRILHPNGSSLTFEPDYLRTVRDLGVYERENHTVFIANQLRKASSVTFRPKVPRRTAIIFAGANPNG